MLKFPIYYFLSLVPGTLVESEFQIMFLYLTIAYISSGTLVEPWFPNKIPSPVFFRNLWNCCWFLVPNNVPLPGYPLDLWNSC